jgi:hypothetical protein
LFSTNELGGIAEVAGRDAEPAMLAVKAAEPDPELRLSLYGTALEHLTETIEEALTSTLALAPTFTGDGVAAQEACTVAETEIDLLTVAALADSAANATTMKPDTIMDTADFIDNAHLLFEAQRKTNAGKSRSIAFHAESVPAHFCSP